LTIFKLLKRRDQELADAIDNPRRSTAMLQLARLKLLDLLTEEEWARFSPQARETVEFLMNLSKRT
jgi:hypothetical protein